MRVAMLGLLIMGVLVCAVVGAFCSGGPCYGQYSGARQLDREVGDQLIAWTTLPEEGRQQITLIDPQMRVMGVYHVDLATGRISLKSVRSFQWDLQMDEFNGDSPSPKEIRSLLQQR